MSIAVVLVEALDTGARYGDLQEGPRSFNSLVWVAKSTHPLVWVVIPSKIGRVGGGGGHATPYAWLPDGPYIGSKPRSTSVTSVGLICGQGAWQCFKLY